jgi:hypothetical protein
MAALRCLGGFVMACLAWAVVQTAFIITPGELATGDAERFAAAGGLLLLGFVHALVLAAPFVLAGALVSEQRAIRSLAAYVGAAAGFAALIFVIRAFSAGTGQVPFVARYVFLATVLAGCAAGAAYWVAAGRHAGKRGAGVPATAERSSARPAGQKTLP